jgi:nucleoid-associated protein YgaU
MGRAYAEAFLRITSPTVNPSERDIPLHFNPADYTITRANTFAEVPIPGLESSPLQYVRGVSATLTISKLTFDTSDTLSDVRTVYVARLQKLMSKNPKLHAPPIVDFIWAQTVFHGVITNLEITYQLFHSNGVPLRAEIKLTMKEHRSVLDQYKLEGRNQSSPDVEKRYVARAGETLSSIAAAVFRDPAQWRAIALANAITDPRAIAPGTVLTIPRLGARAA